MGGGRRAAKLPWKTSLSRTGCGRDALLALRECAPGSQSTISAHIIPALNFRLSAVSN